MYHRTVLTFVTNMGREGQMRECTSVLLKNLEHAGCCKHSAEILSFAYDGERKENVTVCQCRGRK